MNILRTECVVLSSRLADDNAQDMTRTSGDAPIEERIYGEEIDLPLVSTLGRFRAQSAQRLAWHSHENVELIFLQGGASSYEFAGTAQVHLTGGQFLLVPAKTLHRGGQDIRMPSELCGIVLGPFSRKALRGSVFTSQDITGIRRTFGGEQPRVEIINGALRALVKGLVAELQTFRNEKEDGVKKARVRSLICLALIETASILDASRPRAAMVMVVAAEKFLRKHHSDRVTMDDLAEHLGLSRARMFEVFKKETGLSPNDYLQRHRVECCKGLLSGTDRTITDIALGAGFGSSQYFSRVFRRYCGMTPMEFRNRI
jgi:AraC-like DNA-binding protein